MRASVVAALLVVVSASSRAGAQLPPLEATRAGPRPATVAHAGVVAFARTFAAARDGERLLVLYVENDGPRGALRSALFRREGAALARAREDVTLAPEARSVSLAWDGARGAVAYVVPRVNRLPPPSERPRPVRRVVAVGVPASTADPLGPSVTSGGDVAFLRLDAQGLAVGASRVLFTENSRLWRAAVARDGAGWAVAWTGAAVTDDEVRGTVRAMRLTDEGQPTRPMASATGFAGDVGDVLRVVRAGDATLVVASGQRCAAREGEAAPPSSVNNDPSAQVDLPGRNPQPQATPRFAPGPPVVCEPARLHAWALDAEGAVGRRMEGPWLRSDAASAADGAVVASVFGASSAVARVALDARGFGATTAAVTGARIVLGAPPEVTAQSTANLTRPTVDAPLRENPVAPPSTTPPELARVPPRALAGGAAGPMVAVTGDRRGMVLLRDGVAMLATTPRMFFEAEVLPEASGAAWVLSREGTWSGPLRWFDVASGAAPEAVTLPVTLAVPPATARPSRYPLREPLVYDEEFSRLWVHTRLARGQFMRHENIAGMMAARPEAPTDPRMPGLLAVRRTLQNRWEVACSQLRRRAVALARAGAGDDVVHGVNQLCDIHAELRLGVPVDPSL